ncbi:MAG: tetratricopeptide repeat protein [Deltaproteobacteria bacterium]|nr:tetratricopeptide repeat protein [Myxococcales bacterium]MDP3213449.1 tetratricopeptide repeat protein [Deltaproteobacteria bacterium]
MATPRRQRWRWMLPMVAALDLLGTCASAQPLDLRRRRAEARAAFEAAEQAWRESDYPRALAGFRRAQELSPHPATLYNVARAEEQVGHVDAAIEAYEAYLRAAPEASDADEVRRTIASLRASREPVVTPPVVTPPVVTPPVVTPPVVTPTVVPPLPSTYERIVDRRRHRLVSGRVGLIGGFAAPRDRQNFAVGLEGTVFLWRSLTLLGHALWIQTDGSPVVVTGEAGWTFVGDDFDLAVLGHAGVLLRCDSICRGGAGAVDDTQVFLGGITLKVDVLFHPRVSAGLYGRFSWQQLNLLDGDALLSSIGLSVSLHL